MKAQKIVRLNLASHPLRNTRLYSLVFLVLAGLTVMFFAQGTRLYLTYRSRGQQVRSSIAETEDRILSIQRQERNLGIKVQEAEKANRKKVDLINSLIYRKSFSWISFLGDLEEALPESCYLVSLSPSIVGDAKMEVRLKVVCSQYETLLKLIGNLHEMGFQNVSLASENRNETGNLVAEISLIYEKLA